MLTKQEVYEIINNGENSGIEFMIDDTPPEEFAKEVVAFLNFRGGIILLGVRDDGTIIGIKRSKLEEWVMNIARHLVKPGVIPWYEEVKMEDGKSIALIRIDQGTDKPYYVERGERKIYYIRVGSTSREATKEELGRLFQESGFFHFDTTAVYTASPTVPLFSEGQTSLDILDEIKIWNFFKNKRGVDLDEIDLELEKILLNTNIAVEKDGVLYPSVAGILLFGKEPHRYLPYAIITAVRFRGVEIDNSRMIDRRDIKGTLDEQVEDAILFVQRNTRILSKFKGIVREDKEEYHRRVIREVVVNALIHRNYSIIGSQTMLFIFDDRLEVRSPGKLPNTVNLEMLKKGLGRSYHRNPTIAEFMQQMGYGERIGSGIPMVLNTSFKHSGKYPSLREVDEEFWVTLFPYMR
ncbi:MAG: ATP-binding protein [Methanosarcinales archaeon]